MNAHVDLQPYPQISHNQDARRADAGLFYVQ